MSSEAVSREAAPPLGVRRSKRTTPPPPAGPSTYKVALSSPKGRQKLPRSHSPEPGAGADSTATGTSGRGAFVPSPGPGSAPAESSTGPLELSARARQVEATERQISVYISQAKIEVERYRREIDEYPRSLAARPSQEDERPDHETQVRYLQWWRTTAAQKEEGLRYALERMQEAYANGMPVDATVSGVLSVAVKHAAFLASLSTPALVEGGQDGRSAADPTSADGGPRVIVELKGSIIDPLELRSLREGWSVAKQGSNIPLPARVIHRLQDVVPHEGRQVGLLDRIHHILSNAGPSLPAEKKAVARRFARAVQARASPDIIQPHATAGARATAVEPLDLDILVSQILSPDLDAPDVLAALSALLQVLVEALPPDVVQQSPLLRHNVIATLFLRSAAPDLAVAWLLDVPAPPAAERASYNDTYRVLAATLAVDWPAFRQVTEALLGNRALCDVNSLARVVFLQGLILRHDTVPDFFEAFDWACAAFAEVGLATTDPRLALRVCAGYADAVQAHELKLRLESRLELVEAEEHKRRRARPTDSFDSHLPPVAGATTTASADARSRLLSDSEVVKKYNVTLDRILLEKLHVSTAYGGPSGTLPKIEPPRVQPQDVWSATIVSSLSESWARVFAGRTRSPPPKPATASVGHVGPALASSARQPPSPKSTHEAAANNPGPNDSIAGRTMPASPTVPASKRPHPARTSRPPPRPPSQSKLAPSLTFAPERVSAIKRRGTTSTRSGGAGAPAVGFTRNKPPGGRERGRLGRPDA
jgi:hypothetical protein